MKAAIYHQRVNLSTNHRPPSLVVHTVWRVSDWEKSDTHSEGWEARFGFILYQDRFYSVRQLRMLKDSRLFDGEGRSYTAYAPQTFEWRIQAILPKHIGELSPRKINFGKAAGYARSF